MRCRKRGIALLQSRGDSRSAVKANKFGNGGEKEGLVIGVDFDAVGNFATERYAVFLSLNFLAQKIVLEFGHYRI